MFIRAPNPIWYMVDHVGESLNDEYFAFFLTNTLPYIPQNVYRDPQGLTVWTADVVQFSPAGTLPDNLYFDPTLVYRIEIRHGDSQTDELIWEINDFVPCCSGSSSDSSLQILSAENQISNSQFSQITFLSPISITTAGTYEIAPGWELILTGVGTTTITQLVFTGDQLIPQNPPYALRIANSGWGSALLIQRLNGQGAIWQSGAIGMSIAARAVSSPQPITLSLVPEAPSTPTTVISATLTTAGFQFIQGVANVPPSDNSNLSNVTYVDAQITLPANGSIDISNVQLVGQDSPLSTSQLLTTSIPYQQEPIERQIDHLFHYYRLPLERKPIPSYLVGWSFPLNPAQLGTVFSSAAGANTSFYSWDQTIIFQSANSGIQTSRVTNGFFSISASVASQAAIIQYLPSTQARLLCSILTSVYIEAFSLKAGNIPDPLKITISLWATADGSLPSIASNNSIVATLDANGKPATFNGNWTELLPLNSQEASATLLLDPIAFDGWWNGNALASTATYFAIVIGTATIPMSNSVILESVSLQKGAVSSPPGAQTPDDVLRECQFYYEKSYQPGITPGTVTATNSLTNLQNNSGVAGPNQTARPGVFTLNYKGTKNTAPVISFYGVSAGTVNNVDVDLWNGGSVVATAFVAFTTNWVASGSIGLDCATYNPNTFTALGTGGGVAAGPQAVMKYHYVADSRLGI